MKMKWKKKAFVLTLLCTVMITSFLVTGCSSVKDEASKATEVVKKVRKKPESPKEQEAVEKIDKKEEFFPGYTAKDIKDPFASFLKDEAVAVNKRKALTPLEKYDLGELKLVGVLVKGSETVALVEDNEGKGYTVKKGTRMGRNGGVVGKITVKEVFVIEEFFDISGRKIRKEKKLTLPIPGGE